MKQEKSGKNTHNDIFGNSLHDCLKYSSFLKLQESAIFDNAALSNLEMDRAHLWYGRFASIENYLRQLNEIL